MMLFAALLAGRLMAQPIEIGRCHLNYSTTGGVMALIAVPEAIHIRFTNIADKTVDEVDFVVTLRGTEQAIRDVGSFAPHVRERHVFEAFHALRAGPSLPQPVCRVASVRFADGTRWTMPSASPTP